MTVLDKIIAFVSANPGLTIEEIAKGLSLDVDTVTSLIDSVGTTFMEDEDGIELYQREGFTGD